MKVEILKQNKKVKGEPGDVVECPAAVGNPLAGFGVVRIVEHDKPDEMRQMESMVVKGAGAERAIRDREGLNDE